MNRRDVLYRLAALPGAVCIRAAEEITSNEFDIVIAKCEGQFTQAAWEDMSETLQKVWPDKRVIVIPEYMNLEFLKDS